MSRTRRRIAIRTGPMKPRFTLAAAAATAALAGLFAASGPAGAETRTFAAAYDMKIWGLTAGRFDLNVTFDAAAYKAATTQKTTGLVRSMVGDSQDYKASSEGVLTPAGARPTAYRHQGGKRNRLVTVSFTDQDVVTVADPPMGMGDPPATREQKLGATDSVSSFVEMLAMPGLRDPCNRTIKVFDGRGRFDLVFRPDGREAVATGAWKGQAFRCSVAYKRIAGFRKPDPGEKQEAFDQPLKFLFAPLQGGLYAPVRVEMPTEDVGVAVLEARSLSVNGG